MEQQKILSRIELLGIDDFIQIVKAFKREVPDKLAQTSKRQTLSPALHSLKGMCYACGLESLGNHIAHIERMIKNGAYSTANSHLESLDQQVKSNIHFLDELIQQYQSQK